MLDNPQACREMTPQERFEKLSKELAVLSMQKQYESRMCSTGTDTPAVSEQKLSDACIDLLNVVKDVRDRLGMPPMKDNEQGRLVGVHGDIVVCRDMVNMATSLLREVVVNIVEFRGILF
jgi:hypothetical protein